MGWPLCQRRLSSELFLFLSRTRSLHAYWLAGRVIFSLAARCEEIDVCSLGFLWRLCFTPRIPCGLAPFLLSLLPRPKQVIRWLRIALPPRHFLTACCLLPVACCCCSRLSSSSAAAATTTAAALFTLCLSFPHALTCPSPFCLNFYFVRVVLRVSFGIRPLISFSLSDVPSTAERQCWGNPIIFLSTSCSAPHFYSFCPFLLCIIPPRTNLVSICF